MPVYGYEISIPDAVSWPLCRVLGLILLWMPMFYQQAGSDELMHDNVQRCRIKLPAERAKCGSPSFQVLCPLIPLFFFPMFDKALFRGRLGAPSRWAEGFHLA